jgi:hypothetical protein
MANTLPSHHKSPPVHTATTVSPSHGHHQPTQHPRTPQISWPSHRCDYTTTQALHLLRMAELHSTTTQISHSLNTHTVPPCSNRTTTHSSTHHHYGILLVYHCHLAGQPQTFNSRSVKPPSTTPHDEQTTQSIAAPQA